MLLGGLLVLLLAVLLPRRYQENATVVAVASAKALSGTNAESRPVSGTNRLGRPNTPSTPEEIVAHKVKQFARDRRAIMLAMARRKNVPVPGEAERFFAAIEKGDWKEIERSFTAIQEKKKAGGPEGEALQALGAVLLDAYGAAEQGHLWPAQKLLDYGQGILDSLKPGMVYVGGTDSGRWVPALLNDTSGGERHMIVTQNALADMTYLDYVSQLYGGQLATLTKEDSDRAFKDYMADAQKRLEHDKQFPDEPKQVKRGETITLGEDGKVSVSGQVAVMAINERLLQALMDKNPDVPFGIQESFPLTSTYPDALPMGALMELRAADGAAAFTDERATQAVDYWRNRAEKLLSEPEASASTEARLSFSHDAVAQANLLASHEFFTQAEQAYRLASELAPANPEAISGLAKMLVRSGQTEQAQQVMDAYVQRNPGQQKMLDEFFGVTLRPTAGTKP
jgi:hypothetical protein